jgi:hypothetical protein
LLKLQEYTHAAQLIFNRARVGGDKIEDCQRTRNLPAPGDCQHI